MTSAASSNGTQAATTLDTQYSTQIAKLRAHFASHVTRSEEWRREQLEALLRLTVENEDRITAALAADMGKPVFESSLTECVAVATECRAAIASLHEWMKPERSPTPLNLIPAESFVVHQPRGVVLNIAAFNYPFQLSAMPLIAALAAGNCCVIKPSEMTPKTSALIKQLFEQYLDKSAVHVVLGSIAETSALLRQKWDYILFTGSETVGRVVLQAAAQHLTPVTLELGGKSPCIVDETADLPLAARRIVWGKCLNAGQTCISPDYVLVHESVRQRFIDECKLNLIAFYGADAQQSKDLTRIVNERHAQRLIDVLNKVAKSDILAGGRHDVKSRYVEPTLIASALDGPSMQSEIFGPLLPIVSYRSIDDDVLSHLARCDKPLALYLFSSDKSVQQRIIDRTSSGGVCINDVMMHFANSELPFGGVGASGFGAYHGKHGFTTFSHAKPVLNKSRWLDAPQRYPPYTTANYKVFRYISEIYRVNSSSFNKAFKVIFWPLVALIIARALGVTIGFRAKL